MGEREKKVEEGRGGMVQKLSLSTPKSEELTRTTLSEVQVIVNSETKLQMHEQLSETSYDDSDTE